MLCRQARRAHGQRVICAASQTLTGTCFFQRPEAATALYNHEYYMRQALREARLAFGSGEVPVGAVVVDTDSGRILARGHNQTERLRDPTAHAEMIALTAAFGALGAKYLPEATLYVTLEPCLMCCGALYWGKVGRVVYGGADPKNGYRKTVGDAWPFHPKTDLVTGILADECTALMRNFFALRR